ncbi:unnamed protein product [Oppiella nova]|uniref:Ionotropic glutamate receptor L-glutamate and glycine-binding domain-containing protein n=1 Tax=Oppiella nova TaxID=334625 RepID=A0A7R9MBU7_9ACAR|nr:unnamed protein product [Oppiella nova]CAG2174291.1 unnamed protein product [Oppiella nova]
MANGQTDNDHESVQAKFKSNSTKSGHQPDCQYNWGRYVNGTWTGLIGVVSQNLADIGLAGVSITSERAQVVDFTESHILTSLTFITPPPLRGQSMDLVLRPFHTYIWLCLMASLILMIISVYLITIYYIQLNTISMKWCIIAALLKQNIVWKIPNILCYVQGLSAAHY